MCCSIMGKNGDKLDNRLFVTFCCLIYLGFTLGDVNDTINIDDCANILDMFASIV